MASVFKKIFGGIGKAFDWLSADDEKLRQAKARYMGDRPESDTDIEDTETDEEQSQVDPYDVWDEIDSMRATFFLGNRMGKMVTRGRRSDLKEKLEELEKKREEEESREKGEG